VRIGPSRRSPLIAHAASSFGAGVIDRSASCLGAGGLCVLRPPSRFQPRRCGATLAVMREAQMIGDDPTRGSRLWLFIAAVVAIGLFGAVLMLFFASKG
jgi:hypothetical protein